MVKTGFVAGPEQLLGTSMPSLSGSSSQLVLTGMAHSMTLSQAVLLADSGTHAWQVISL